MDFIYWNTALYQNPPHLQYLISLYNCLMLFGINEVVPRTTFECAFCAITMLISAMINANLFGVIAMLVQNMNTKSRKFQEQMDTCNTAMKNLRLPSSLMKEVAYYLRSTQMTQDSQEELQNFLDSISPSLRAMIQKRIFTIALRKNEILKSIG